ncbi:MAG: DUF2975 domain-containing protein [Devosia sp.]
MQKVLDMPDHTAQQRRVTRLSRATWWLTVILAGALPLLAAGWWGFATDHEIAVAAGLPPAALSLDVGRRVVAALLSALPALALSWGLWQLSRALRLFGSGQPFQRGAANGLRGFGWGVIACAVLKPVAAAALSVLVTFGTRQQSLSIQLSSDTLLLLVLGAVMMLVGRVLGEAVLLAEENAQFV